MIERRTFIAHVEDVPGVLNRIASLFRRRGFNIESLTVGKTDHDGISRMTIVARADDDVARLIEANLYKLVNVLAVEEVTHHPSMIRDLALIKVRATVETRPKILEATERYWARAIDEAPDAMTLEVAGTRDTIDELVETLRPFGIVEMVRTGVVAMTRGGGASGLGAVPSLETT